MAGDLKYMANKGNDFPDDVNDALEKMAEDSDKNYDTSDDKGQDALMTDLVSLTREAFDYEFHDFKNKKYAAPKMALRTKLLELAEKVKNGSYDN